ncbi:hypothetical protein GMSM_46100 [Geomonas sp. Red276]
MMPVSNTNRGDYGAYGPVMQHKMEKTMNAEMVQVDAARLAKLEDMERKQKLSARRASIKNLIFVEKAKAAGIKVSKEEVDARMESDSVVVATA